jgi:hypothetical protein
MGLTNFPNGIEAGSLYIAGTPVQAGWRIATTTATFAGGTANARGDYDGNGNPATLFTVTGTVMVVVFGHCTTDLAGASATLEVGVTGNTAAIIAQTTATGIDATYVWRDAGPALGTELLNDPQVIVGGFDIIETSATANITGGVITYYCLWLPLSADGNVVAA